jgi:PAS domain S-box-containing protein
VRAFGEMVALLAEQGNHAAAIELESLWNDLQRERTFTLLCAYPMHVLDGTDCAAAFDDICNGHSRVIPAESQTARATSDGHSRELARLQQRAASLEAEVKAREDLEMAALRLAAIVESSDDAIIGKTLEGTIVDWNAGAQRLYGYTAAEVIGRPISVLIPEDRPDELPSIIDRLRRGERIDHFETERITRDGRRISVSVSISPIRGPGGKLVGASAIARDISGRKRAEQDREELLARERQTRSEAEAALRLRDEFLSIASHELRTPLATLKGYAQLALRRLERIGEVEPERVAEALRAIANQSDKLNSLLSQLLDVSRLELGNLALERRPTDVVALVEQVIAGVQAREGEHAITLAAQPSETAEVDPLRLEQVLTNLLDNAVKYAADSGPIEVTVYRAADNAEALEIAVRDHGLGISPEKRGRIFERFYRAHGNGHKSGMGLGLYVSRQIVELHGGEITAEFPDDGGSRFVVRLPLIGSIAGEV